MIGSLQYLLYWSSSSVTPSVATATILWRSGERWCEVSRWLVRHPAAKSTISLSSSLPPSFTPRHQSDVTAFDDAFKQSSGLAQDLYGWKSNLRLEHQQSSTVADTLETICA